MNTLGRLMALALVFLVTSSAWMLLGGVTYERSSTQSFSLRDDVVDLWGEPLVQQAPTFESSWYVPVERVETVTDSDGSKHTRTVVDREVRTLALQPDSTDVDLEVNEDVRRKGLVWFPMYDLGFQGSWSVTHTGPEPATLYIRWRFPVSNGFYDDFVFRVDGEEREDVLQADASTALVGIPVQPGQVVELTVGYRSRGMGDLSYRPSHGVGEIRDFHLGMTTDFADIDFPSGTLSPSSKERAGAGWKLDWDFDRTITGKGMGMVVPSPIQPGELAASMALSAPFSLGLFMVWIFVLGMLKGIDVHPMNHVFLAAAFFAFHLLFAYTADHIPVEWAFALSSVVSVFLVVSYLYRVVSPRFAVIEAGLAQLVYLVGFSMAHFQDGLTGLTLTVIGVLTLFALMQLTSGVNWTRVFAGEPVRPVEA